MNQDYIVSIKIHNTQGHSGLPDRFIVASQYGYLGQDSFGELKNAVVFATERAALAEVKRLYPNALLPYSDPRAFNWENTPNV